MEEGSMYYVSDAIDFICSRSDMDEETVRRVLELEMDYMESIGLIVKEV